MMGRAGLATALLLIVMPANADDLDDVSIQRTAHYEDCVLHHYEAYQDLGHGIGDTVDAALGSCETELRGFIERELGDRVSSREWGHWRELMRGRVLMMIMQDELSSFRAGAAE